MEKYDDEYFYRMGEINRAYYAEEISAKEHRNKMNEVDEDCE